MIWNKLCSNGPSEEGEGSLDMKGIIEASLEGNSIFLEHACVAACFSVFHFDALQTFIISEPRYFSAYRKKISAAGDR